MSRAFIKEPDGEDAVAELPDRQISLHPNLVTAEGLAQIEDELARLQREHAAAQTAGDRVATARAARELRYWNARRARARTRCSQVPLRNSIAPFAPLKSHRPRLRIAPTGLGIAPTGTWNRTYRILICTSRITD